MPPVLQSWVCELTFMQQSVLISAIRGPDGLTNMGPAKLLLKWLRRCVLHSALDGMIHTNPYEPSKGKYTGPSIGTSYEPAEHLIPWEIPMNKLVENYLDECDQAPFHFHMHLVFAAEVIGYLHPDNRIRTWWNKVYRRFVNALHMQPEPRTCMMKRLGDNRDTWLGAEKKLPTSYSAYHQLVCMDGGTHPVFKRHNRLEKSVWETLTSFKTVNIGDVISVWEMVAGELRLVVNNVGTNLYLVTSHIYPYEQGSNLWLAVDAQPLTVNEFSEYHDQ